MLCSWDNNTVHPSYEQFNLTNPTLNATQQIYNIPHNFSTAGDHTLTCNMSNFVSSQVLEFNVRSTADLLLHAIHTVMSSNFQVTVFDRIVNFTTAPGFYPNRSDPTMGPPLSPLGPNSTLLPLEKNFTFTFDYAQGKSLSIRNCWSNETNMILRHLPNHSILRTDQRKQRLLAECHCALRDRLEELLREHLI